MSKVLVTGGTSGIGRAVANLLIMDGHEIATLSKDADADIRLDLDQQLDQISTFHWKNTNFDAIIHCAGVNHLCEHKYISERDMVRLFRVNALATFFLTRLLVPRVVCSVVSDAAWTPMTHSLAYNVSKAAQHMVVRQMAHEDCETIIFGVAPGKVANTGMSEYIDNTFPPMRGWTYKQGREYQLKGLRTGEVQPEALARFIVNLVEEASPHYNGHIFPFGG